MQRVQANTAEGNVDISVVHGSVFTSCHTSSGKRVDLNTANSQEHKGQEHKHN